MKRSEFLKRLGLGIAAIPLAPQIIAATKEVFDGEKVNTLLSDEAGNWPDPEPKDPEWGIKHAKELYAHYEEPWIHEGWPLRVNDLICVNNSDKQYLVTAMDADTATCTPLEEGPVVYITRDDTVIRFSHINPKL